MNVVAGILVAAALFALMGWAATRPGSRLERAGGCEGWECRVGDGSQEGCDLCEGSKRDGWWLRRNAT